MRPQCSVFVGASLDGFIARRDGALDWLDAFPASGEDHGYQAFFDAIDAVVVGRNTWEVVLRFPEWPYAGKRVIVLTHGSPDACHGETFFAGDPAALVERLAAEGVGRVYVDGGATVSEFLRAGLVDDLTVSVIPILLGDGIRLFQMPLPERSLGLESARSFPSGLVQLRYRAAPPRATGA